MFELPAYIDPECWAGFTEMRLAKGKRTPFTDRAARMIIKTLEELHQAGHDANASLDQSTRNGWSDVYMPRKSEITPVRKADEAKTNDWLRQKREHADEVEAQRLARMAAKATVRRVA